jgi:hypothetical protein
MNSEPTLGESSRDVRDAGTQPETAPEIVFINFKCPYCGAAVSFPEALIPTVQECPFCSKILAIPQNETEGCGKLPIPLKTPRLTNQWNLRTSREGCWAILVLMSITLVLGVFFRHWFELNIGTGFSIALILFAILGATKAGGEAQMNSLNIMGSEPLILTRFLGQVVRISASDPAFE